MQTIAKFPFPILVGGAEAAALECRARVTFSAGQKPLYDPPGDPGHGPSIVSVDDIEVSVTVRDGKSGWRDEYRAPDEALEAQIRAHALGRGSDDVFLGAEERP